MKRPHRIRITGGERGPAAEPVRPTDGRTGTGLRGTCLPGMKTALKRILLVEDDPQVREFGLLALRGCGYEVLSAESASQAQRIWGRQGGGIDLLVADMMIPNCSTGLELARRFRRDHPSLPVIIMSGFGPEIAGDQAPDLQALAYLRKPFKVDELLRIVANSLRAPAR